MWGKPSPVANAVALFSEPLKKEDSRGGTSWSSVAVVAVVAVAVVVMVVAVVFYYSESEVSGKWVPIRISFSNDVSLNFLYTSNDFP